MISIKTPEEIQMMKESGAILKEVFAEAAKIIKEGISTKDLDDLTEEIILSHNAIPSFKGYGEPPFPGAACVSVNDEVVHGIPSKNKILKNGDIVSLDIGAILKGWHSDACRTFFVGEPDPETRRLVEVTEKCFWLGLEKAYPGNRLGDISHAVQTYAEENGYGIVKELCGHGIGRELHEDPMLFNFGKPGRGVRLCEGMVLALEPMLTAGSPEIVIEDDEWTISTADGKLSAHYENSFAITADGPLLLTCERECL